ncbi:MAG: (d)CMP kinase [Actinomycetota bacterium]|nr:(d)CMP kinase [Actinomycetota bacterium]
MTVISIDGPAGAGKSSVARALAEALGFYYLDTGAMYRAVAAVALDASVAPDDEASLEALARRVDVDVERDRVLVGDADPSARLRDPDVTRFVPRVSAYPGVRAALAERQRDIADRHDVVMEGRDIGTVVAPDARVKFYLTADLPERARRRAAQLGAQAELSELERAMELRDAQDQGRAASPLAPARDAVMVDSTGKAEDEVVSLLLALVRERLGTEGPHE